MELDDKDVIKDLDDDALNDDELNGMLREWKAPSAPARLRERIFAPRSRHGWRRLWTASVRVPLPVAAGLLLALALGAWRWVAPPVPRVLIKTEIKTERVEVPAPERVVTRIVYRDRPVPGETGTMPNLQPVTELRPRIIRSRNAENK